MLLHEKQQELQGANEELFKQARTDPLTGLQRRLKFNEDVRDRWMAEDPSPHQFCAIMCDIDWFKQYNDSCGHVAGDDALRLVGEALSGSAAKGSECYRFGGDEMLIVAEVASESDAVGIAERLQNAVEELTIPHPDSRFGVVTASFGVALLDRHRHTKVEHWLNDADGALYAAKANGRNQVCLANRAWHEAA